MPDTPATANLDWSRWPNFSRAEMACKGPARGTCARGGRADMDIAFMDLLQSVRDELGFALPVSSGFRCPAHNASVSGGPAHPSGRAADIRVYGERALLFFDAARAAGIRRIGMKQHGPLAARFVHVDTLTDLHGVPTPWTWTYR